MWTSSHSAAYNSGAVSSIGIGWSCQSWEIWIENTYAPPASNGYSTCWGDMTTNLSIIFTASLLIAATALGALALSNAISTPTNSTSSMYIVTASSGPNVPAGCSLAKTQSNDGYSLELYLRTSSKIGDQVCIDVVLRNTNTRPLPLPNAAEVTIADSKGDNVFRSGCVPTGANVTIAPGNLYECTMFWNSGSAYNGVQPQAGTYQFDVNVSIPGSGAQQAYNITSNANVTLSTG